ncbi:MAG: hypothetical protein IT314_05050 [Anaerolineales bacterium]|nr:hypothetical protein [Anaerolineales bacterium]
MNSANLSDIIAFLALLLGLANFFILLWDRRPQIKVNSGYVHADIVHEGRKVGETQQIFIDVVNLSSRKIRIHNMWVEWRPQGRIISRWKRENLPPLGTLDTEDQFLFRLEAWDNAHFVVQWEKYVEWMKKRQIREKIIYTRVTVRDVTGKWYFSKKLKIDIANGLVLTKP